MNSTIYLYRNTKILPDRMFKVDSIETYLSSLNGQDIFIRTNFMYVKHALNTSIKVDFSQDSLNFRNVQHYENINYCAIQNGNNQKVYYFVIGKKWIAEQTIQFELYMDTLNTFVGRTDLLLSDKTKIIRQHKDRWQKDGSDMWPLIDLYSEEIQPVLYGSNEITLNESSDWGNQTWYLVYRNQNEPSDSLVNPVDCFLVPDHDEFFLCSTGKQHIELSFGGLETSFDNAPSIQGGQKSFIILRKYNKDLQINFKDANEETLYSVILAPNKNLVIFEASSSIVFHWVNDAGQPVGSDTIIDENSSVKYFEFVDLFNIQYGKLLTDPTPVSEYYYYGNATTIQIYYDYTEPTETIFKSDFAYISPISLVDKTRAELIKIIECPYCPTSFYVAGESTSMKVFGLGNANWGAKYVSGIGPAIYLVYLGYDLQRQLSFLAGSNDNPFKPLYKRAISSIDITANKNDGNEPKLYHSDYYQPKLYYDSFGFVINLEKITQYKDDSYNLWASLRLEYRATSTINSRFAFKVVDYVCSGLETQDYNNVFVIARNNELPIYNQQYINYLRAGYNYDVKSKQRTEATSWLGVGLSAIGSVASFISSGITHGFGVASGITLATSTAIQFTNAVKTTADAEQNIEAKQKQLQMQATSVYGSDDVDLMEFYAGNRLRLKTYKVSERMKKALFDLFFYCGYIHNVVGSPNISSRTRFNFIQAEPIFRQTPNLPQEIVDDIVAKYRAGFTYLHYYNNEWDWEQAKENWETSLF